MAPELAVAQLPARKGQNLVVLDPMMGSGTIPITAALRGYHAIGVDTDPLAVLIATTSGRELRQKALVAAADRVVNYASLLSPKRYRHPDPETQEYIDYWFDTKTQRRLGALAAGIETERPALRPPLWCAFSRLIVTKDAGASRARDVSHSRPHRVRDIASFDPVARFPGAVESVIQRHFSFGSTRPSPDVLKLLDGDARRLPMNNDSVDIVVTSPPYLQAIDYMRGHRMSLVWMGHSIGQLRELRGHAIGTERGQDLYPEYSNVTTDLVPRALSPRANQIVGRYINDLGAVIAEVARVLRPRGQATFVVADATVRGHKIPIPTILERLATYHGFVSRRRIERDIPGGSRYLPPPRGGRGTLDKRMRVETCLTFQCT
jgi:DNA modification methylase